jgi:phenylacetate-coenzyme A ligase PaaK-like adenylate-forming protein
MRAQREQFIADGLVEDWGAVPPYFVRTNGTLTTPLMVSFDMAGFYDFNHFSFARILSAVPGLLEGLDPTSAAVFLISDAAKDLPTELFLPALGGALLQRLCIRKDPAADRELVRHLRGIRVPVLHSKPHELLRLMDADVACAGGERIRPELVFTSGDCLYPAYRERLEAHFGCPVLDVYACSEGGIVAVACPHRSGLHVQVDRVLVEVLDAEGCIRPEGTGELVITNFANWGHAFVRYRMADHGEVVHRECECGFVGPTIVVLRGRDATSYAIIDHGVVDTRVLAAVLERPEVKHFQGSKEGEAGLVIRWVAQDGVDATAIGDELSAGLREVLGTSFRLEPVGEVTRAGGKLRRWI